MNIIIPIIAVALVLGLIRDKMTPRWWTLMILAILVTLGHYALKH